METVFEKHLDDLLTNPNYEFILVEEIWDVRDDKATDTDTPYQPICRLIKFNEANGSLQVSSEEEVFSNLNFPAFRSVEIGLGKGVTKLDICKRWNNSQHKKAVMELSKWEEKNKSFEQLKRINYFSNVIGLFDAWYYDNGLDSEETPFGFKPSKGKEHELNFDKEINDYISYYLKFYGREENKNKLLHRKEVAKFIGMSGSTISRRFNAQAPKFLPIFIQSLKDMRDDDFQKMMNRKSLNDNQKNILLQLEDEIQIEIRKLYKRKEDFKATKEKVGRAGNLNTDQIQTEKTRSDKASSEAEYGDSKEAFFSDLDGEKVIKRPCNNCKKEYPVPIVDDNDIKYWEKEAKKYPEFYGYLTCSDECRDILIEKNKVVKPTNKTTSSNKKSTKETDEERKERIIKEFTNKQ